MSLGFHCPTCKRYLVLPDSAPGKRIRCLNCGQEFLVPELDVELVAKEEPENPSVTVLDSTSRQADGTLFEVPRTQRKSQAKSSHAHILLIVISVPALVILVTVAVTVTLVFDIGLFGVERGHTEDSEMLRDQLDLVAMLNRKLAISQEIIFWAGKEPGVSLVHDLNLRRGELNKEFDKLDRRIRSRWGTTLKNLRQLNSQKADESQILSKQTEATAAKTLDDCHTAMRQEQNATLAKIKVEAIERHPLAPGKTDFDLSTELGRVRYEEYKIRQATQDQITLAERDLEIAERYGKARRNIALKWVNSAHSDIEKKIVVLETAFKAK